jgi:hypothetical protein
MFKFVHVEQQFWSNIEDKSNCQLFVNKDRETYWLQGSREDRTQKWPLVMLCWMLKTINVDMILLLVKNSKQDELYSCWPQKSVLSPNTPVTESHSSGNGLQLSELWAWAIGPCRPPQWPSQAWLLWAQPQSASSFGPSHAHYYLQG